MLVSIIGPNLRDQSQGEFHVHAAGCRDIARMAHRDPEFLNPWTIDADSTDDVVLALYGPDAGDFDLDPDDPDDIAAYAASFHFAPCTRGLS